MEYFQVRYNSRVVMHERKMFIRLVTGTSLRNMLRKHTKIEIILIQCILRTFQKQASPLHFTRPVGTGLKTENIQLLCKVK